MQLRRLTTLGLALALGACALHEPLGGVGGDAGGDGGSGAAGGSAGGPGTGGKGGAAALGGRTGKGGQSSAGGAGGNAGSGAGGGDGGAVGAGGQIGGSPGDAGASGGRGGADAGKDSGPGDALMCGPICDIFCPNGNVIDDRGCPTCKCKPVVCPLALACSPCPYGSKKDDKGCETCQCNPPPQCNPVTCKIACPNGFETGADGCPICACKPATCEQRECGGPPPGAPLIKCWDGSIGGPVCERTNEGRCAWIFRQCPDQPSDCAAAHDANTCDAKAACRWLEPGCTEPKLPSAGCFDKALIGCGDGLCPAGKTCLKRVINPCAGAKAGIVAPPVDACAVCGVTVAICL